MRTTLTLEPDVAQKLRSRMAQEHLPLKRIVNEALRAALSATPSDAPPKFTVKPFSLRFKPGFDSDKLNQLVDELEAEEFAKKLSR